MVSYIYYAVPAAFIILYGIRKYRQSKWGKCQNQVQLDGKIVIITGANSGIGYATAKNLSARGATVILACRNEAKAQRAIKAIEGELNGKSKLKYMQLDLASLESIKRFATKISDEYEKVDILINNAGVAYPKHRRVLTTDKLEMHFGVNYLGHFFLTQLLLASLRNSEHARVINVSSQLHQKGKLQLEDLNYERTPLLNAYADSKLQMLYFTRELAKRQSGNGINVYSLCPGWVYTNLFRHNMKKMLLLGVFMLPVVFLFMRTKQQGAQTVIYCATEPSLAKESGCLYRDCKKFTSTHIFNDQDSVILWEKSENILKEMHML